MKKILKPLFCAAALVLLAGCNKFDEANATPETSNGSLIKVYANVAENDGTRANINVGESVFTAEWEAGDALGILPVKTGGTAPATAAKFNYNTASAAFEGSLNDFVAGGGNYYAFFPHAQVTGTTANLPFGNLRTQTGNDFNSAYDALVATPQAYGAADETDKVDGNPVAFTLHRLTSILDFSIATQADKVKYLLLTAGGETQKLSASSLDFALENGGAETAVTLSTTDQSNVIALQYTPDGASADKVEAFFNVPADLYPTLTLDVIGSDNQMATVTVNRTEAFKAGTLYTKAVSDLQFAPIDAPSLVWPEEDGKTIDQVHYITTDESGMSLNYSAAVTINVPGGIAGLSVNITSDYLNNDMGITTLDLFNETSILGAIEFKNLGLACTSEIQYKKSTIFNITNLVPLVKLGAAPGSTHIFEVQVTDLAGQKTVQKLTFQIPTPITYNNDADLWTNTATFTVTDVPSDATNVKVQYRIKGTTDWKDASDSGNGIWTIEPVWSEGTANASGKMTYTVDNTTGVFAGNDYEYQLIYTDAQNTQQVISGEFQKKSGNTIPTLADNSLACYTSENTSTTFWGSGNNEMTNGTKTLCSFATPYTVMTASGLNLGFIKVLAPGNLFTGTFTFTKSGVLGASSYGTVGFGQPYTYTARPTALELTYKTSFGSDFYTKWSHANELTSGHDQASIMVCIVNWDARHNVTSGNNASPSGVWNPETLDGLSETEKTGLIAYGVVYLEEDKSADQLLSIPLTYYDKNAPAPNGKYTIIISCSTSRYGDYLNGTVNTLSVKDFQWVY